MKFVIYNRNLIRNVNNFESPYDIISHVKNVYLNVALFHHFY